MGIMPLYARFMSRLRSTDLRPIFLLIILVATWLALNLIMPNGLHAQDSGFSQLNEIPEGAQQVTTGVYPLTVYSLDIETNTYYMDAYVWFRWQGEIDPTLSLEFVNAVEDWGMTQTFLYEEPTELEDGSLYQIMRIEGRFFQPFTLEDFPLDQQQLTILIEDSTNPVEQLVYVPDLEDSGIGDTLRIPGWEIKGWSAVSQVHHYDSQFGETGAQDLSNFAALRYEVTIARPINYFIWKLLLPLFIVLCANWTALLLHPSLVEARTAMPATALLTTVFLQQSYSSALPEVGYLVLLDKIYVLAYALLIITVVQVIAISIQSKKHEANNYARAERLDRFSVIAQVLVFVIGVGLIVALR
jgi:hypothetical protein